MDGTSRRFRSTPRRYTRRSVKVIDALARMVITLGGLGTIAAVLGVCVFLLWVAWPLFRPPRVDAVTRVPHDWAEGAPLRIAIDETGTIGWAVEPDGLQVFRVSDGKTLAVESLASRGRVTAVSFESPGNDNIAIGCSDGTLRAGQIRFVSTLLSAEQSAKLLSNRRESPAAEAIAYENGLVEPIAGGQLRLHRVEQQLGPALATGSGGAIRRVDAVQTPQGSIAAVLREEGEIQFIRSDGSGQVEAISLSDDIQKLQIAGSPDFVVLVGGDFLVAWPDGTTARFAIGGSHPQLIEMLDLVRDPEARLTALAPLAGRGTLIVGDSTGALGAWFMVRDGGDAQNSRLILAHELPSRSAPVTAIAASGRTRAAAIGYGDGQVQLVQVTDEQSLLTVHPQQHGIDALSIGPRQNEILAAAPTGFARIEFQLGHPEATAAGLFRPIWYQDYPAPAYVWQSSGGSAANEPKFSIVPLLFGTIKATVYSLLFAVPIALAAAVYTSEFLDRRIRARIKPTVELMASLPSVVLGYLAAFVLAPAVARHVPSVLASFVIVPVVFLFVAYLLQLMPERFVVRLKQKRFLLVCGALPVAIGVSCWVGPLAEGWFFGGDLMTWLSSNEGSAAGGWLILMLPLSAMLVGYLVAREVTPRLRRLSAKWSPARCAAADLAKFLLATGAALALAFGASYLLARWGFDARGAYLGSYVQRNALIVGFAMGFAIIPLIYTIAEDALSSVPEHLRSASLGAGATPWQTTLRIIIPTAMSGLFSAVMIGLGRAVGETMIVLMAAGNTPIMDWNIFDGFRTLSANLAVELPEAEQGSTHFRILFLTALALFAMTFVVNTVAELVRQRFRRRAYQL